MSVKIMNNTEIPPIWLSVSNRQNDINPSGFRYTEITTKEHLEDSLKCDHLFSEVRDGYREDKNFNQTEILWADIDNKGISDEKDFVTIEKFQERFKDYKWILYTSKSHQIEKDGESPRDKFHVMFPLDSTVKNGEEVKELHNKLYESWMGDSGNSVFDVSVSNPTRFFFGTPKCASRIEYNLENKKCITQYIGLLNKKNKTDNQITSSIGNSVGSSWGTSGNRNNDLTSIGGTFKNRFNLAEGELYEILLKINETFFPPLQPNEVQSISKSLSRYQSNQTLEKFWNEDDNGDCKSINVTSLMEDFFKERGFGAFVDDEGIYSGKDKNKSGDAGISVIKKEGNVIYHYGGAKQKEYLMDYLKEIGRKDVRSVIDKKSSWYSEFQQLSLGRMDIEFLTDSPDKCHLYFQNGVVEITKDSIELIDWDKFKMGDKCIWDTQKKNRDIQIIPPDEMTEGDFEQFVNLTMSVEKDNKQWELDEDELKSFKSAYGFMIHDYKDKSNAKLILFIDKESSDNKSGGEGSTGKSLVMGSVKYYKNYVKMEGSGIDSFSSFGFSDVNLDTQFVEIDDVDVNKKKNDETPIRDLFSKITGDFTVDKKYGKKFTVPFETSPKLGITSNNPIGGADTSSDRRYHVVEFSPYWNRKYKINNTECVTKHFGRRLFDDWDDTEWNRFYNFGFQCVQEYLKNGLSSPERITYKRKQLVKVMGDDTHNWINLWIDEECPKLDGKGQDMNLVLSQYLIDTGNTQVTKKELKKHMKLVSDTYGHTWMTNTKDGRLMSKVEGVSKECVLIRESWKNKSKRISKNIFEQIKVKLEKFPWE